MTALRPTVDTQGYGMMPPPPGRLAPGTVIGEWRIEAQVGEGGMGTVYAAVHTVIGKRAAIKVIRTRLDADLHAAERFLQEARVVNQIGHPNIVDIFQLGKLDDGRPYLVMELLQGMTLGDRLDAGRVPTLEAIDILLQVCAALAAAHAQGVIHRDLKPDNVFLSDQRVKLVDWGIAKMKDRPLSAVDVTGAGTLMGTPRYIAPEQARGQPVDDRTDVYALGTIAHELFLEAPVFACDNVADLIVAHLREPVAPPSEVWPDIPPRLEALLLSMLDKDATRRPSVAMIVDELETLRGELGARITPPFALGSGPVAVPAPPSTRVTGTDPTVLSDLVAPPAHGRAAWSAAIAIVIAVGIALSFAAVFRSEVRIARTPPPLAELPAPTAPVSLPPPPVVAPAVAPPARKATPKPHHRHLALHPDAVIDPFR